MPSDRASAGRGETRASRRRVLTALGGVATVSTAGCSDALPNGDDRSDAPIEVSVENRTTSRAEIAVRVIGRERETLFGRVFALDAETIVSRGAIETTPTSVRAFTSTGVDHTWRYDPDLPVDFDCEREDIGLTLHPDETIEPWYTC